MNQRLKRLTRIDIEKTAKDLQPGTVKLWSVEVAGKCFPVKQLVREAANRLTMPDEPPVAGDLITSGAVKKLQDERFNPVRAVSRAVPAQRGEAGLMQQAVFVDEMFKAVRFVRADGRVGLQCPMCTFGRPLMPVPENASPTTCMQCGKPLELRPTVPLGDP